MIGTGQAYIPPRNQSPIEGFTVAQMIGNDIEVSKSGKVTGTIKYLSGVAQYGEGQQDGHYFPTVFDKKNYGKELHVGGKVVGDAFVAGKEITPSEEDPYLVIRVENCTDENKITVYDKETKDELFTLDFNDTSLAPPSGKYAVTIPETSRDFGGYGKASDFYDVKPDIQWSGVNGTVTGTFKWFEGNDKKLTTAGNYYPLVLNDFYQDKDVTVNGNTANEYEWIVKLTKGKPVTVKYEGKTIAVLDFSKATLSEAAKIKMAVKTPAMSVQDTLPFSDEDIVFEEKHYNKSEINRMSTADLQALADEKGIEGAYEMTGSELKTILIEMLVN